VIRALIFDFDGLILDTETPEYESWVEVYQAHGCVLPLEQWTASIGLGAGAIRFDPYADLASRLGRPVDRDAIRAVRRARFSELVAAQPILPGVVDYLHEARRLGLRLGVATSSDCAWVNGHLARLELAGYFDAVRCADMVTHAKPHPELYLAVTAALGVAPGEAIALEDSPNGIAAAKAAGLFCVAVPNPLTRHLALDRADLRLASLMDLPLSALLAQTHPPR
jgi:HAD superfamily hydrolase (TIGR01509 family)